MWQTSLIHYLVGFVYLVLFSRWLWVSGVGDYFGLSRQAVLTIFLFKVFWCFVFVYVHLQWSGGGDTLDFFQSGDQVYRSLFRDPADYLKLVFLPNHYYVTDSLYHYNQAINRYGDESTFFIIRLLAIFRLFSFGSYSAQAIMYSLLTLPGILFIYAFCMRQLGLHIRTIHTVLLIIPATSFWIHGMHKEALLLSACGMVLYPLTASDIKRSHLIWLIIGLVVLTLVRSHYLLLVVPLTALMYIHKNRPQRIAVQYLATLASILLVILLYFYLNDTSIRNYVFQQRDAYAQLSGLQAGDLPLWQRFLCAVPGVLCSPFSSGAWPTDISDWLMYAFTCSAFVYLMRQIRARYFMFHPIGFTLVFASLIEFGIIGCVVVQHGGIARYRAPFLCLFILGILAMFKDKKSKKNLN